MQPYVDNKEKHVDAENEEGKHVGEQAISEQQTDSKGGYNSEQLQRLNEQDRVTL